VIRVADLVVSRGGRRVLDGADLEVPAGQFVGLVGPNGAGKTTLLRTVDGTLSPDAGTVAVDGRTVHDLASREQSRLVATVPQDAAFGFAFGVREVVAMGRTPHRGRFEGRTAADREAVERAMERTAVTDLADRPVTETSGGERRRVLLARALAQETPALLLDEPTASLDVSHQVRTLSLVADLVDEGRTALAAIHDLDLAARFCDAVAVVAGGEVLAAGDPEEVLTAARVESAFGTRAVVRRNPVTDSVQITALGEDGGTGTAEADGGVRGDRPAGDADG
jgi:iron complex transport system ATP-binding protein